MAVTTSTTPASEGASRLTPAAPPKETAAEAGSDVLQTISGMIYSGSYALVYAAVFVGQSLPKENPVMNGFRDGGRAVIDELGGGN